MGVFCPEVRIASGNSAALRPQPPLRGLYRVPFAHHGNPQVILSPLRSLFFGCLDSPRELPELLNLVQRYWKEPLFQSGRVSLLQDWFDRPSPRFSCSRVTEYEPYSIAPPPSKQNKSQINFDIQYIQMPEVGIGAEGALTVKFWRSRRLEILDSLTDKRGRL